MRFAPFSTFFERFAHVSSAKNNTYTQHTDTTHTHRTTHNTNNTNNTHTQTHSTNTNTQQQHTRTITLPPPSMTAFHFTTTVCCVYRLATVVLNLITIIVSVSYIAWWPSKLWKTNLMFSFDLLSGQGSGSAQKLSVFAS